MIRGPARANKSSVVISGDDGMEIVGCPGNVDNSSKGLCQILFGVSPIDTGRDSLPASRLESCHG